MVLVAIVTQMHYSCRISARKIIKKLYPYDIAGTRLLLDVRPTTYDHLQPLTIYLTVIYRGRCGGHIYTYYMPYIEPHYAHSS